MGSCICDTKGSTSKAKNSNCCIYFRSVRLCNSFCWEVGRLFIRRAPNRIAKYDRMVSVCRRRCGHGWRSPLGKRGAGADPGVGPPRYSYELFYYFGTWLFLSFTDAHAFNVKGLSGKALLIQRIRLSRKKEISRNVGSVPSIQGEQGSPHIISRGKCVNISTLFQTMKAPCNSY
jgi:hypothetical protein